MSTKTVAAVSDHFKLYGDIVIERGQVFELQNKLNDLKLLGWNYIREVEAGEEIYACKCGRRFLGGVTDGPTRAHLLRWRGDCSPLIDVDGVNLKGRPPTIKGGGNPDGDSNVGWDLGVSGDKDIPAVDPYKGERMAGGKERPKRIALGG